LLPFFSIRRDRRAPLVLFSTALVALAADQLTKLWIRSSLQPGDFVPDHGPLRLTYSTNDGIIFGIGAPLPIGIIMPMALVSLALLTYFWYGPIGSRLVNVSLGLFIGGTVGNWLDRVLRGGLVTDFIDVRLWGDYHWFTFNVADACIVMAIVLFALQVSGLRLTRGVKQRQ
jgi:signal peptidase II